MAQKTILAIDDDPDMLCLIVRSLADSGYEVVTAGSGREGLRRAHVEHPDLILLDLVMQDMDGWQTLSRLQRDERCRDIPVVILSSREAPEDKIRALQEGASDFLTKPFTMRDSIDRIQAILKPDRSVEGG